MKKIMEGIFLKDSGIKGNITTIMVGVHGDEYSGVDALDEIIDNINVVTGKVYFIYANLEAIKQNIRYTEKNLNRCFFKNNKGNTYEETRAIEIINYLNKSNYLLDIHNTTSSNSSLEMLITTNIDYAKYFNIEKVVSHIDDVHKGGSDGYMDNIGGKGFCLECGSINFGDRNKSIILAKDSIINFLKVTGNIEGECREYNNKKEIIKMDYMYETETDNFNLYKNFKDFEELKSGDIVAYDGKKELKIKSDSIILFAHNLKEKGKEGFCIGHAI